MICVTICRTYRGLQLTLGGGGGSPASPASNQPVWRRVCVSVCVSQREVYEGWDPLLISVS